MIDIKGVARHIVIFSNREEEEEVEEEDVRENVYSCDDYDECTGFFVWDSEGVVIHFVCV